MEKRNILGISYDNFAPHEAAEKIYEFLCSKKRGYIVTPNAEIAHTCFKNEKLRKAVSGADFILADGAGVVLASKILGTPLRGRVTGVDTASGLLCLMAGGKKRLYILGAVPGVAEKAADNISQKYPGIEIAGVHHGYFKDSTEVIGLINKTKPDMVFVALGYPRQEIFMYENKNAVNAMMMGIGGSVDIFAGKSKRAPDFFVNNGLEWLYRLIKQPYRIGRMMKLPLYIIRAVIFKFTGGRHSSKTSKI